MRERTDPMLGKAAPGHTARGHAVLGLASTLTGTFILAACAARTPGGSTTAYEPADARGQDGGTELELPPIEERTRGLEAIPGALPLWWDAPAGRLLAEAPDPDRELLYYVSLPAGLGSNDVGLDRAQIGTRRLVEFRRAGGKVLLTAPNLDWRSTSPSAEERRGAREAFAESVIFGFEPAARSGDRLRSGDQRHLGDPIAHGEL